MKMQFARYYDYRIAEEGDNTIICPTLETEMIGKYDKEFLQVDMTDDEYNDDDLLNVNNTDRRMYNELIALMYDETGEEKDFEVIQTSILEFVRQNGNIGSSVIEEETIPTSKDEYDEIPMPGGFTPFKIWRGFREIEKTIGFHRRKPSMITKEGFVARPDCLFYKGKADAKGTVFSDIYDLKLLVDQYNSETGKIDINLMNTHLLECNVAEIFDYNEDGELVLTAFFDTIIGLAYWQLKNDIATNMNIKQCAHCGKYFTAKNPKAKYCQNRRDYNGNSQCARAARNKISNSRRKVRTEAKKGTPLETLLATIKDLDIETIETEYKKVARK